MNFKDAAYLLYRTAPQLEAGLVLTLANAIEAATEQVDVSTHEARVRLALNTPDVINALQRGNQIVAIKALRAAGGGDDTGYGRISLLHAKEAVQDDRVKRVYYVAK